MADQEKNTEPPKCAGGCGFFGNPACENYCSKCYRDRHGPDAFLSKMSPSPLSSTSMPSSSSSSSSSSVHTGLIQSTTPALAPQPQPSSHAQQLSATPEVSSSPASSTTGTPSKKKKTRCHVCNSKLGMLGFECRCDGMFCSKHRFPDDHECAFDYKSFDREKIAKQNQTIKSDKLNRI